MFGGMAGKGNTDEIMKELKERREQKILEKKDDVVVSGKETKLEEGDQEKINKLGNILIQGTLKRRSLVNFLNFIALLENTKKCHEEC